MKSNKFIFLAFIILSLPLLTFAQAGGTIRGTVTSETENAVLHDARVQLVQLRRSTTTNQNGVYEFTAVPPGTYTILVQQEGFADKAQSVVLAAGAAVTQDFALSLASLREEVTVTASGAEQSVFESFQSVNSVASTQITERAATGLGEVLENQPGVGKRSFGAGSSRPVIRGFDGDRVLIAQDGIRTGSLGSQSGDHGEPVDVLNVQRIEIVKGPATLLYGSNAVGGVVNVISNDDYDFHEGARGYLTFLGNTNNEQAGVSGGAEYGFKKFLFNISGTAQREGDFRTPLGRVPNSGSRYQSGSGGVGYFTDKGFLQGNYNFDRRRYGNPYVAFIEEEGLPEFALPFLPPAPEEAVDIKMRTHNGRLRGGLRDLKSFVSSLNFSVNYSDYRHKEIENEEVGTIFDNDVFSYRSMFEQKPYGKLTGRFGFEGFNRSYQTVGAEQLINGKVRQQNFAVFALEEFGFNRVALQIGGRVEHNRYNPENDAEYINRSFTGFSGSAGVRFNVWKGGSLIASATTAYRAPALEELYNEGVHIGNVTFEIGNQNLSRERSNGIEFSFRQDAERVRFNGSFYYYNINDFVFLAPQDLDGDGVIDRIEGFPVAAYEQANARFIGADLNLDFDIHKYLGAFLSADIVNAKIKDGDVPLPRITPGRIRAGLDFRWKGLSLRPEAVYVGSRKENEIFPLETTTGAYALFNLNGSYTYSREHTAHIVSFSAFNLADRLYRNHLSFIKNIVPEPGRGLRASYTIRFF